MGCSIIETEDGSVIFFCGRGLSRPKTCQFCRKPTATLLCDHPVKRGTCDADMCRACATEIGLDTHHCPSHSGQIALAL